MTRVEEQLGFGFDLGPPCAFGETGADWPGPHHCRQCAVAVEEACRQFAEAVARGDYNERGYTPGEWKAKLKRQREREGGEG